MAKGRSKSTKKKEDKKAKEVDELKGKLEALKKERDEIEDNLAYMQAEFENLKKRSHKDVENRVFRQKECLMLDLLSVVDNLQRALQTGNNTDLENFTKGVRLIGLQFDQILSEYGLKAIETDGKDFDPFKHDAVEKVEDTDRPDGLIIEELQKGYTLNGSVIRPSKVRVNVHPKGTKETQSSSSYDRKEGGEINGKEEGKG